ncbi:unnamed protein product, partial [Discosporangium mesarthrocarpum]
RRLVRRNRSFGTGAFAYVLRKKGAIRLVELALQKGIQQAVDWFMFDQFGELVCYKADPPLARTPEGVGRDTDNTQ